MISKAQAGYVFSPETPNYRCADCVFLKDKNKCAYFGEKAPISAEHGSCNRLKGGSANTAVPWFEPFFTKDQLGYMENNPGFGCRRCKHFEPGENDCDEVQKQSVGFTPGRIDPKGCCDLWKKDSSRGGMSEVQLTEALKKKPEPRGGLIQLATAGKRK